MKRLTSAILLALSGCATPATIVQDRPVEVDKPVAIACVAGTRPAAPVPLKQVYQDPAWAALDVGQKAAIVGRQGLAHKAYGETLNAATAACP